MEYYESYFDEDLDEDLSEDSDELFEDLEEDDGLSEASRASRQQRRRERRDGRRERRQGRRDKRRGGGSAKPAGKPATTGAVQDAFENVGQDITKVQKEVKKAEIRQFNEQMNDIIASVLFRPRMDSTQLGIVSVNTTTGKFDGTPNADGSYPADPVRVIVYVNKDGKVVDKDGNFTTDPKLAKAEVGYKFTDSLLALLAVKFIGNMKGPDTSKGGFQQYMPLLAGVALSPSAQKDLGLGGLLGSGNGTTGSTNSVLSNLTKDPAILLLLLFLFMKK